MRVTEQQIELAIAMLRKRAEGMPSGYFRGVPAEAFARDDLLRFLAVVMVELKDLREWVNELEGHNLMPWKIE